MSTRGLLKRLFLLAVLGLMVFGVHELANNDEFVYEQVAPRFVPPYEPISPQQAMVQAEARLERRMARYLELVEKRKKDPCAYYSVEDEENVPWTERNRSNFCYRFNIEPPALIKPTLDLAHEYESHKQEYVRAVVRPVAHSIKHHVTNICNWLGALLGLTAAVAVLRWFSATVFPALKRGASIGMSRLRLGKRLGALTEERRLEKARRQILTLEKLLESDLITKDEYERRRAALRESLKSGVRESQA